MNTTNRFCKWCGKHIDPPVKAHVIPPCTEAPLHIKNKWDREASKRNKLKKY